MDQIANTVGDSRQAQSIAQSSAKTSEVLLLGAGPTDQGAPHKKQKVDPIYGPDAAETFVADHFKEPRKRKGHSAPTEAASSEPKHLAVFVNLSANRGLLNSSLREDESLRKLAALTKDKSVTVVAQVAMNRDMSLNHLKATQADRIVSNLGGLDPDVKQIEVVRYEMADGKIKLLSAGWSKGLTQDLGDLLSADPNAMKADHVMLLNRAHGTAMHGIRGDAGYTSIPELKATLQAALDKVGKSSFDVTDLDSCLMGNGQVATELAPQTKFLIGSEESEVAVAKADKTDDGKPTDDSATNNAQPITEAVRKLIMHPDLDVKTAATETLRTNQEQCHINSPDGLCGANTLALYDESAAPQFSASLDHFGQVLTESSANSQNMDAFQKAAQNAPVIDGEPDGMKHTIKRRDLASFVTQVEDGLSSGQIVDSPDHDLKKAADQLQGDMTKLVAENFNNYRPGLKKLFEEVKLPAATLGGISVFLQDRQPKEMQAAFDKQLADDSIPTQPHWNEFVKILGEPI